MINLKVFMAERQVSNMNEKISKDKIIDTFNSNDFNNKEEAKSETNLTIEINNMIQEIWTFQAKK